MVTYNISCKNICYTAKSSNDVWHSAFLDTGVQTSVIGLQQAKAYWRFRGDMFNPRRKNFYRFGNDREPLKKFHYLTNSSNEEHGAYKKISLHG